MEPIEFGDKTVICKICGESFHISVSEQLRWKQLGLEIPRRCYECRKRGHRTKVTCDKPYFNDAEFERVMANARNEIKKWK